MTTLYDENESEFIFSHFQISLDFDQTIISKNVFEAIADTYDIEVKSYLAGNKIFARQYFKRGMVDDDQQKRFCAVSVQNRNDCHNLPVNVVFPRTNGKYCSLK